MVVCQVLMVGRLDFPKIALGRKNILKQLLYPLRNLTGLPRDSAWRGNKTVLVEISMVMKCLDFLKLVLKLSKRLILWRRPSASWAAVT